MHVCSLPEGSALTTHTIGQRQHDKAPGIFPLFYMVETMVQGGPWCADSLIRTVREPTEGQKKIHSATH